MQPASEEARENAGKNASKDEDLLSLYQQVILDHGKSPRNTGVLERHDCSSDGKNPLCGDKVTVMVALNHDESVSEVRFEAKGCAISIASASMMSDAVKGLPREKVQALFEGVRELCSGSDAPEETARGVGGEMGKRLEPMFALSGVRQFRTRAKCAMLAWTTLLSCLESAATDTSPKTSAAATQ